VLAGGGDIDPARYAAARDPHTGPPRSDRDHWELALVRAALERQVPIFAICRGMQILNVALGGDIIQHLPDVVGHDEHRPMVGRFGRHDVTFAEGSQLVGLLGRRASVATYHHQAVGRLGDSLVATAWADDKTVEAVEYQGQYLELIDGLSTRVNALPAVEQIDRDPYGPLPRVNVSVKLSSLYSQFDPMDPEGTCKAVSARLRPFLPIPIVGLEEGNRYRWLAEKDLPQSIGRLSGFMGNAGVLLRAYIYMRMLGREGMSQVGEYATLNANYLLARLKQAGFDAAYPSRRASHEFIITLKRQARELDVTTMDFAKRLLDHGFHAPTTYFPLLVPECLLIEPTETEGKDVLDAFVAAMTQIQEEAEQEPERVTSAPHTMPVRRLDDVRAAKQLDLRWKPTA